MYVPLPVNLFMLGKVNSVEEACTKYLVGQILKFEILPITHEIYETEHQILCFQFFTNRFSIMIFFNVVCKISNFNQ